MKKLKSSKRLKQIGLWATIWWGLSGAWVVLAALRWAFSPDWITHELLLFLLVVLILGWVIGAVAWLQELKRLKISYKAGLKDLFLTLR